MSRNISCENANKILVFDSYHYFFKFLKYDFKNVKFVLAKEKSILDGCEISKEFCLIVFVCYYEEDVVNLLRMYSYGIQVLICNHNPKLKNKFINVKNIDVVECLDIKYVYRDDLHRYINEQLTSFRS